MEVIWFCKHIHIARHVPFILNINANTCTLPNSRRHHSVRAPMLVCSFALTPLHKIKVKKKVWRCSNIPANSNKGTILTMPSRQQSWGWSLSISCKLKFGKDNCRTPETRIKDYRVLEGICFTWDNSREMTGVKMLPVLSKVCSLQGREKCTSIHALF